MTATAATVDELKAVAVDEIVDARGTSCPGPILAAKKGIATVPVGGVMQVLATDSGTLKDLPAWCTKVGHDFLGSFEESGYLTLFIRRAR